MYTVTVNDETTRANSILSALEVLACQLRRHLPAGGTSWCINDPTGTDYRGHTDLRGRTDELETSVTEIDNWLYTQLHRAADNT